MYTGILHHTCKLYGTYFGRRGKQTEATMGTGYQDRLRLVWGKRPRCLAPWLPPWTSPKSQDGHNSSPPWLYGPAQPLVVVSQLGTVEQQSLGARAGLRVQSGSACSKRIDSWLPGRSHWPLLFHLSSYCTPGPSISPVRGPGQLGNHGIQKEPRPRRRRRRPPPPPPLLLLSQPTVPYIGRPVNTY